MAFQTREGVRLCWKMEGAADRPVLLLLHSIGTDMHMWEAMIPQLLWRFRVLRMDLRGHGASDAPPGDYSLKMFADDVLSVMQAAGVERATVCGLSLGGMTAMELALEAPGRVSALVLACTSAAMDPVNWKARLEILKKGGLAAIADVAMERFFAPRFRRAHADQVGKVRADLLKMNVDGYAGAAAAIRDMNLLKRIDAIKVPTLIIAGRQDVSTPYEGHGDKIKAAIAGARTEFLDAAHLAAIEMPSNFAALLLEF